MRNESARTTFQAIRVQKGKSRQGCLKCKARHVKCDELRPNCGNCSRLGIPCPGFERVLRWSSKHERSQAKLSSSIGDRRVEACLEETNSFGVHVNAPVVDTQGEVQVEDFVKDAGKEWPDYVTKTQACMPSTSATAVTNSEVEQTTAWNVWNSNNVTGDSDESTVFPVQASGDVVTSVQKSNEVIMPSTTTICMDTRRCAIIPNPIDIPTTLIEYWFTRVCQMWSTFDSDVNYNRQIATVNCTTSEVCFYALQSMSAACLLEATPDLKDSLTSIILQASTLVRERILTSNHDPDAEASSIAIDLIFAVFALGTSLHWTEQFRDRDSLLVSARLLLRRWQLTCGDLQPEIYAYFRQALVYWEMILSVTNTGCDHKELSSKRERCQRLLPRVTKTTNGSPFDRLHKLRVFEAPGSFRGSRPNSWCGISSEVVGIFGQVLTLYRNACERQRGGGLTTNAAICDAICDLEIAHELQHELLAMNFNSTVEKDEIQGFSLHTGDVNTPLIHHVHTAEAYRLASLLQLYLAFADLEAQPWEKPLTHASGCALTNEDAVTVQTSRTGKLQQLSSQLLRILVQISPWSGSRRMQPMLYITAAAGLGYEPGSLLMNSSGGDVTPYEWANTHGNEDVNPREPQRTSESYVQLAQSSTPATIDRHLCSLVPTTQSTSLDISTLRDIVLTQLGMLQQTLPIPPLGKAIDLVKAIWAAYDIDASGTYRIHWPDIMVSMGLQTVFG